MRSPLYFPLAIALVLACGGGSLSLEELKETARKNMDYLHETLRPINLEAADITRAFAGEQSGQNYTLAGDGIASLIHPSDTVRAVQMPDGFKEAGLIVAYNEEFAPAVDSPDYPFVDSAVAAYDSEEGAHKGLQLGPRLFAALPGFPERDLATIFADLTPVPGYEQEDLHIYRRGEYVFGSVLVGKFVGTVILIYRRDAPEQMEVEQRLLEALRERLTAAGDLEVNYPP